MARATLYPGANRTAQWFASRHPGRTFTTVDKVVLHTAETSGWPGYGDGASAPNLTLRVLGPGNVEIRQHFPLSMSSRALVNRSGGVETNTDNAVQVELIGTCARGGPGLYWPGAPEYALRAVAQFLAFMHREWGVPLRAPSTWLAYGADPRVPGSSASNPAAAGASIARMSFASWRAFSGVCGHQHVPENDHGDPGSLDIARILRLAGGATASPPSTEDDMPFTEAQLKAMMVAAIQDQKDEISTEVWNRFAVRDSDGVTLVHLVPALQELFQLRNAPVVLSDDDVDRIANRVAELLRTGS